MRGGPGHLSSTKSLPVEQMFEPPGPAHLDRKVRQLASMDGSPPSLGHGHAGLAALSLVQPLLGYGVRPAHDSALALGHVHL